MSGTRPVVVVVGGGVAGLTAAWELVTSADPAGAGPAAPDVHVIEGDDRLGGALQSAPFAGRPVDLAADAFVARRPEATELCTELGLADELVAPGVSGASVWARGRLRPLPDGLNLGVPTRWWSLARSGILSPGESLRVARDLVRPHFGARGVVGDQSVGAIVEPRLGRPVVDRLVDPLIGGINAGTVDELSAAATFPFLLAASLQPGSLMRRLGRNLRDGAAPPGAVPGAGRPPVFWSLTGGIAGLARALAAELERRGVRLRTGVALEAVRHRDADRHAANGSAGRPWRLDLRTRTTGMAETIETDGVVLAVPAPVAAVQLAPHAPEAAGLLSTIDYAPVAVVTLAVPAEASGALGHGTGVLVPRTAAIGGTSPLVTAVTFLSRKWPHLSRSGDELLRASVGRAGDERHRSLDDDELLDAVLAELGRLLALTGRPNEWLVTRFDRAFPQYRVGHLVRVARIEQGVAGLPGIEVAGSTYRGVGIPACIGSGRAAARRLLDHLSSPATADPAPVPYQNGHR